ncbi:cell wall-associated NlpC family hydrolase [Cellulosimicrobium cellulans]|uniref:C40 family peptidase n=1 Tax=Cellulosimicrobium cellulans TaxID=1710 RepID=UPI0019562C74|nr:C40 family peptidase [Cellulosimicrobium cellulans]MBM7821209.1 cell wall-associated NlpC family hydrolase [Cellulosimicrobium cellulans]
MDDVTSAPAGPSPFLGGARRRPATRPRRLASATAAGLLALVLGVGLAPSAWSDPPSDDDVRAAREAADGAARDVATVEGELASLRDRQSTAEAAVETAAEEYAAAQDALAAADAEVRDAQEALTTARTGEADARAAVGALFRASRQGSTDLDALRAVLDADGVGQVVERENAERVAGRTAGRAVDAHATARAVADTARARADAALAHQGEVEDRARDALAAAQVSSDALADAVQESATRREALLAELARARATSVDVERQRQDALDAQAASERETAARARVEAPATGTPSGTPAAPPTSSPAPANPAPDPAPAPPPAPDPAPAPNPAPAPTPAPPPDPPPVVTPPPGTGVGSAAQGQAAVAWARTKIGAPYVFGGTGPGYDCSGLTSRAWAAAGVDITRTSRSQYQRVQKISYDQLRPGDLVFYANDTSNPSTIRHVAMYTGNGMMIEARQPGSPVHEVAMRWADAMPYAGRP